MLAGPNRVRENATMDHRGYTGLGVVLALGVSALLWAGVRATTIDAAAVRARGGVPTTTAPPQKAPPAAADDSDDVPMAFSVLGAGDVRCPARRCGKAVLGSGDVLERTPADFVAFLAAQRGGPIRTLVLQSDGGDFGGGLQLGLLIRKHRLATVVASGSGCWSACAYAFLGGTARRVDARARYGVHTGNMVVTGWGPAATQPKAYRREMSKATEDGYLAGVGDAGLLMRYAHAMGLRRGLLAATLRSYGDTYDLAQPCMAWLRITTDRKPPRHNPCPGIRGVRAWLCRKTPGLTEAQVDALMGSGDEKSCAGDDEGVAYRMF